MCLPERAACQVGQVAHVPVGLTCSPDPSQPRLGFAGADMGMHPLTAILVAASQRASLWCRSSIRRVLEVVVLVLVTSGIWFLMAYGSPCKELPSKVSPLPQRAVLHCTPGELLLWPCNGRDL